MAISETKRNMLPKTDQGLDRTAEKYKAEKAWTDQVLEGLVLDKDDSFRILSQKVAAEGLRQATMWFPAHDPRRYLERIDLSASTTRDAYSGSKHQSEDDGSDHSEPDPMAVAREILQHSGAFDNADSVVVPTSTQQPLGDSVKTMDLLHWCNNRWVVQKRPAEFTSPVALGFCNGCLFCDGKLSDSSSSGKLQPTRSTPKAERSAIERRVPELAKHERGSCSTVLTTRIGTRFAMPNWKPRLATSKRLWEQTEEQQPTKINRTVSNLRTIEAEPMQAAETAAVIEVQTANTSEGPPQSYPSWAEVRALAHQGHQERQEAYQARQARQERAFWTDASNPMAFQSVLQRHDRLQNGSRGRSGRRRRDRR